MEDNKTTRDETTLEHRLGLRFTDADFTAVLRCFPAIPELLNTSGALARTTPPLRHHWFRDCPGCGHHVQTFDRAVGDSTQHERTVVAVLQDLVTCHHCATLQFHLPAFPIYDDGRSLADNLADIADVTGRNGWDIYTRGWALICATGSRYAIDYHRRVHILHTGGKKEHRELDLTDDTEKGLWWYGDVIHSHLMTGDV